MAAAAAAVQVPSGFPVAVRAAVATVDGERTDLICSKYEDGVFLIASQIGAFGTVLRARAEAPTAAAATAEGAGAAPPAPADDSDDDDGGAGGGARRGGGVTYSTAVLLGRRDEPLLLLAARQLVEASCAAGNTRPLTVALGLKRHTLEGVKQLLAAVKEANLLA